MDAREYGAAIAKRRCPLVVGLTGPSGTGKTEIVRHLLDRHGFTSTHVGMPVKTALKRGFGLRWRDVDGGGKNESSPRLGGVEPKLVLDQMGEGLARVAPLATALHLGRTLDKLRRKHNFVVVDGVRQQAEADLIRRRGGHILRVDDGSGPDPHYPMDKRAWKIAADHDIDTSRSLAHTRGQIDRYMAQQRLKHPAFTRMSHGVEKASDYARAKVHRTMHEFKHGGLHSGSKEGPKVRSRQQALAIALRSAGLSK